MKKVKNEYAIVTLFVLIVMCAVFVIDRDYKVKKKETVKSVCYDMSKYFPSDSGKYEECVIRNTVVK